MDFRLKNEFIELDNLLKVLELVSCGAEAKQVILAGEVKVNDEVEIRVRRKLRPHDTAEFRGQRIEILQ